MSLRALSFLALSFLSLAVAGFARADQAAAAPLDLSAGPWQMLEKAEYLRLPEALSLADVQHREFAPFGADQANQGISADHHWLRFSLHNPGDRSSEWVLRSETTYLDNLVVYSRVGSEGSFKQLHLSDRKPFHSRPIDYRTLSVAQQTPPGTTTEIYLHAYQDKADSVSLRFSVHSPAHFAKLVREENLLLGAFYGALLLVILLSVVVGILLRRSNAFQYALFLFSTLLLWLMLNGYGFQYLWPERVYWHNEGFHLSFLFFVFCALEFSKGFLRLKLLAPRWHTAFNIVQAIAVLAVALRLAGYYEPVLHIAFVLMSLPGLLIIPASWIAYRRGLNYALWSFVAWILYALGLQAALLSAYTDNLQWGMDALFFTQAGSLLETLFLMVAMAKWLVAIESDRKVAHAMAHEDVLTGVGNRRRLQTAFQKLALQSSAGREVVYLIIIDIDRFKAINDNFGHDAGDSVLRKLGELLLKSCRKGDLAVRFGGEEFALLVSTDNPEIAWQIAERIRRDFAEHPTQYGDDLIAHTLCCGIAEVTSPQSSLTAQEMMQRADAALYQAKAAGRNQSHLYRPDLAIDESSTREKPEAAPLEA